MKPCEEYGHQWKVYRRDKLCTDEGTKMILFFKCKICSCKFDTSDDEEMIDDEHDYPNSENNERILKV